MRRNSRRHSPVCMYLKRCSQSSLFHAVIFLIAYFNLSTSYKNTRGSSKNDRTDSGGRAVQGVRLSQLIAGIPGSIPAEDMDVRHLCFVNKCATS